MSFWSLLAPRTSSADGSPGCGSNPIHKGWRCEIFAWLGRRTEAREPWQAHPKKSARCANYCRAFIVFRRRHGMSYTEKCSIVAMSKFSISAATAVTTRQNTDLNALLLEDGDLNATLVTGSRLAAEAQPIVFLNACSVGSSGFVIGRIGGFVANFLESGASGVIAPYWPVLDSHAFKFSLSVYEKLKLGRAVGEALQELRQDYPRDPSIAPSRISVTHGRGLNLSPLS